MKKIFKYLLILVVITLLFGLASCSETESGYTKDNVDTMISDLRTSLNKLIDANKTAIDNLKLDYNEKLQALEVKDAEAETAIAELKSEYETKAKELEEAIEADSASLAELTKTYNEKVVALEAKDAENEKAIAALKTAYEAKAKELEAAVEADSAALAELTKTYKEKVAALEAKDTEISETLSTLVSDFETAKEAFNSKIEQNTERLDTIAEEYNALLSELDTVRSENAEAIEALRTDFNTRLDELGEESAALLGIDTTLSVAGSAADAKATGDAIATAVQDVTLAMQDLFDLITEKKPIYEVKYHDVDITSAEAQDRFGKYMAPGGQVYVHPSGAYNYTEMFPVEPGDTVWVTNRYFEEGSQKNDYKGVYKMRMVAIYDENKNIQSSLGLSLPNSFSEFVIPEGSAYIVISYPIGALETDKANPVVAINCKSGKYDSIIKDSANSSSVTEALLKIVELTKDIEDVKETLSSLDADKINSLSANIDTLNEKINALDVDKLNETIDSIKNLDTNNMNIMVSATIGTPSISAKAEKLESGESITLENNTVINNKTLTFSCDVTNFSDDSIIRLGHGKSGNYGGTYIEITKTHVKFYSVASAVTMAKEYEHKLDISKYVTVTIDCDYSSATVTVFTVGSPTFSVTRGWSGRNGDIFAEVDNLTVNNVDMRWYCEDYQKTVWMVGDSYFSSNDASRWTSYLIKNGYKDFLMMSHSGMSTERGLSEIKQALNHGTPKYIVWCMGMNNSDTDAGVNTGYLTSTEEFLSICEQKGITPILATIPSTPTVLNSYKNEWVKNWAEETGGRYIDFARAVGGDIYNASLIGKEYTKPDETTVNNKTGYEWYADMLYADLVHPSSKGAEALYMQAVLDFPELMKEN